MEARRIESNPEYFVSAEGEVYSTKRGKGSVGDSAGWHRLAGGVNSRGYRQVQMQTDGKMKCSTVHRLVAEAFIPNPDCLPQINHIDGDKTNNSVENLEWCDNSHNQLHAYAHGYNRGRNGKAKPSQSFNAQN